MSEANKTMPIKEIPQSLAAEAAVLGSIILEPACLGQVSELLDVKSFYRYEHRSIYEALLHLFQREPGELFDCFLLRDELVRMNKLDDIGGVEYLVRILGSVPSAANALYYAKIVKDKQVLRELLNAGSEICDKAHDHGVTPAELGVQPEANIFAMGHRGDISSIRELKELLPVADSLSRFGATHLWIDDVSVLTPLSLRAKARRLKAAYDVRLIVIDCLQLMSVEGGRRFENRRQEIARLSRSIKSLAMELQVLILLLSQLDIAPASRSGFLPRLSDLRESGSIEQDADIVLLLHRQDYYHRGERDYVNTNVADLIVAKQRNGPTGTVELAFCPELARFENCLLLPV